MESGGGLGGISCGRGCKATIFISRSIPASSAKEAAEAVHLGTSRSGKWHFSFNRGFCSLRLQPPDAVPKSGAQFNPFFHTFGLLVHGSFTFIDDSMRNRG